MNIGTDTGYFNLPGRNSGIKQFTPVGFPQINMVFACLPLFCRDNGHIKYPMEVASYVFRENFFLTAIGGGVGLLLGKLLHWFVMEQINIDMVCFQAVVQPVSYLYSFALTFLFACIVNAAMFGKLDDINMAESLKSIE